MAWKSPADHCGQPLPPVFIFPLREVYLVIEKLEKSKIVIHGPGNSVQAVVIQSAAATKFVACTKYQSLPSPGGHPSGHWLHGLLCNFTPCLNTKTGHQKTQLVFQDRFKVYYYNTVITSQSLSWTLQFTLRTLLNCLEKRTLAHADQNINILNFQFFFKNIVTQNL